MTKIKDCKPYENKSSNNVPLSEEEFEKETVKFYKEHEMEKARILRNLDMILYRGNK